MKRFPANGWQRALLSLALAGGLLARSPVAAAPPPKTIPAPVAPATPAPAPSAPPAPTPTPGVASTDIVSRAQDALAVLKTFASDAGADQSTAEIREGLPAVSKNVDDLRAQADKAAANASTSLDVLRNLQIGWQKLLTGLIDQSNTLGERARGLEAEAEKLKGIDALWSATYEAARKEDAAGDSEIIKQINNVRYQTALAQGRVQYRQTNILELQNSLGALLARANAGQDVVEVANTKAVSTLFVRDSPALWTAEARPKHDLPGRWRAAYAEQSAQIANFVEGNSGLFGVHFLVFLVGLALFLWLRRLIHQWTEDEPHLKRAAPIFEVPVAAALAGSFLAVGNRYAGAPGLLQAIFAAAALLPTVVILHRLLSRRLFLVLYSLVAFTVLDQIRIATVAFPAVNRWLFCGETVAAIGVFLWLLRAQKTGADSARLPLGRWMPVLCALAVMALTGALGASVLGYVRLGTLLGTATLNSSYAAVFLYAGLRILDGLIVIALRVRPVSASRIAQTHRDQVQAQVYTIFRAVAALVWAKYTLEQLQIAGRLTGWVAYQLTREIPLGKTHSFSLDQVLLFGVAIWLSLLVSRLLRFFLNEEVYERVQLAPGLPYAISTMLNYVVLLVGFAIAIGLLGIPLTQVSIVAGAFSVGLGFGLQNIINNFVSGIILLFERPVKVGDVIQFGDATGEVRRIGIRASIIRTRDGSDIILPNGNLISNQVTNWTYADRSRAVEITLNVATGPEPTRVLAILKAAADHEPATRDRPTPEVFLTGLVAGGFTVSVRAWTNRYENWVEVRSELTVTLHTVLTRENIRLI